jgi:hypothetical protein
MMAGNLFIASYPPIQKARIGRERRREKIQKDGIGEKEASVRGKVE